MDYKMKVKRIEIGSYMIVEFFIKHKEKEDG